MSDQGITKKYPLSTPEVTKMLNLGGNQNVAGGATSHLPFNLPISQEFIADEQAQGTDQHSNDLAHKPQHGQADTEPVQQDKKWLYWAKQIAPYLAVFIVGLGLYYFFFNDFNLTSFLKIPTVSKPVTTPKQSALQSLESQNLAEYQKWIASYYYDVSDPKILDPQTDNSGNGLSNFQKYLLGLNPRSYDTLGLGMADSQALAQGINPAAGGPITDSQKTILEKYVDMEVVMNRLTLFNLQHPKGVAGANIFNPQTLYAPKTGVDFNPILNSDVQINASIPARLEIPSLNIIVPVVWSKDPKDFNQDLQSGVVHYPGTALPGQIGTSYIAGHSSNYPWAKGKFNRVFATLGDLADNTTFKITLINAATGKEVVFEYVVVRRQEYTPTDQAQFQNTGDSLVALSTCWPINSTFKRLVVFGKLTQVVK